MNKLLIAGSLGFALASGSALAADIYKAPPPPPLAYSWTGCEANAGWGYGFWNQYHDTLSGSSAPTVYTTDGGRGWLGRFGGGCDYQLPIFGGSIVIGAFGDYDAMSLSGTNSPSLVNTTTGSPVTFDSKETGAWYAGGRIGYLVTPSFLTYFDVGATHTRFANSPEITTATGSLVGNNWPNYTTNGWFMGFGTEYALNFWIRGLYWRNEYRYASYENSNLSQFNVATGALTGNVEHIKDYVQTITTSLVWRFWTW
jgi:outer membrane immunogenic protein